MRGLSVPDGVRLEEVIEDRLAEAGRTLAALPKSGHGLGVRTFHPEIVRELVEEAEGHEEVSRPARPKADAISRMDEAFGWITHVEQRHLRMVIMKRLIMHPITGRHRYSWPVIGHLLGVSNHTAKAWHADAVAVIARKIVQPDIFASNTSRIRACKSA